ncbi:MAG TPA: 3'-5' exonuclease [Polyangia bacterium]|jgi:DNA helicase-2/ATP-dependent DNA helicase PcrA|nr:3'-5' exonuclease [Polyangia bacterium]
MLTDLVQDPQPQTTPGTSENVGAPAQGTEQDPEQEPEIVREEKQLLTVVLRKLEAGAPRKTRIQVDDASALIELRDALAEAKPEDQGSILEQMHRIEALSRQRGKGDTPPVDRKSPYFGHLRLEENGKRRDVLVGARSFVEPGGGVQIVDWRNAPVSRLFYRYEEGDAYEERLGDRLVEGEVLARRTVAIVDSDLRRVASPQGTFSRDLRTGAWREIAVRQARLQIARDGSTAALVPAGAPAAAPGLLAAPTAAAPSSATRGKLGLDENGARRPDRHLPAIAALIDPRQFELITQPASGLIAVQGSAGSGKTTIGLHRIAYLAFADPRRFRPEKMLVIVYQRALAAYVSRVLPSLDVPGVPVMTFGGWAEAARRAAFPLLDFALTEETPSVVMRAKAHGAFLRIIDDRQAALGAWCRKRLVEDLADKAETAAVLAFWDGTSGPVDGRVTALAQWVRDRTLDPATRNAVENAGRALRARTRDATGEWAAMLTDRASLGEGFARHAPGVFSPGQLDDLHRWCVERERLRGAGKGSSVASSDGGEDERYALDAEDEALLLRVYQRQRGRVPDRAGSKTTLAYEHLMVDEVQDFSPIELAVLLDTTSAQRSVTLAGDTAQAIAPEHGFSDWAALLDFLEIAHERVEPLRVSYRSTREIVDAAEHVLGPLMGDIRPVAPRAGAPVESFPFGSAGESAEFLSHALKELLRAEPEASVALLARHPEQARLYYEALANAEVPNLRLVDDQDFSFTAGIDVTDVRQSKGLEFDIVILLEVTETSYPVTDDARRLLHVAMTRAAHQLWVTYTGAPSPLLPEALR